MSNIIVEKENKYLIQFGYNKRISSAVIRLPEVEYNNKYRRWECPARYGDEVFTFGAKYGFILPERKSRRKIFDEPVSELPRLKQDISLKLDLYDYQKEGVSYILENGSCIVGDQPGLGKSQTIDSLIPTPSGWVKLGDIKIGDQLFSRDGSVQSIKGVYPQGVISTYRVTMNDNTYVDCNNEHIWCVMDTNRRKRGTGWTTKTTQELIDSGVAYRNNQKRIESGRSATLKWEIPLCNPVNFPKKNYLIPPYTLGALIGDGCSHKVSSPEFSLPESKIGIIEKIRKELPVSMEITGGAGHKNVFHYRIVSSKKDYHHSNSYIEEIRRLGLDKLSADKFIPVEYLNGSIEQRFDLLAGLMDTDGSCIKNRTIFHTTSLRIANNIKELVESLGGVAIVHSYDRTKENKKIEYQINIRTKFNPFYLQYKKQKWSPSKVFCPARRIKSIEYIGEREQKCIKVSSPDHLYLTNNYIVTHNTAQAIAAVTAKNLFPCLVICPASLKYNWEMEWKLWTDKHNPAILADTIKHTWKVFNQMGMYDVFITNYESLRKYFVLKIDTPKGERFKIEHVKFHPDIQLFKSVIIDESHRVKDPSTIQSKLCYGITRGKELNLLLSGTPIVNKPIDLLPQLLMTDKIRRFENITNFREMCADEERWPEINCILRNNCYFRREKKSVLKDLPDKTRQNVYCEITNREEYAAALSSLETYLADYRQATDEQIARSMRGKAMVQIGVLKNISARGKLRDVTEYIDDVISSGEKIIVFIYLHEVAAKLKERYPEALFYTGAQKSEERNKAIHDFQKCSVCDTRYERHEGADHDFSPSEHQIIFVNHEAGGVGITLTASSRVLFVEYPWNPAKMDQAEDRAHRISQKNAVQILRFIGKNTIDEQILSIIDEKREMSNACTGATDDTEEGVVNSVIELLMKKI
ncbi:MAG: DEAD/DEAH box helicase [Tannerellaceae bacterium]|nr:DEAD/DEAH box helicase [Tannerellaceae bacterium]